MKFKPMTKEHLWQSVYIEAMRQSRIGDPKELADKAVKDFESIFKPFWRFTTKYGKITHTPFDIPEVPEKDLQKGHTP